MRRTLLIIGFITSLTIQSAGQVKQTGIPYIHHYSSNDYQGGTQNWDMVQTKEGIVYFANNNGILEYNGVRWNLYNMPNYSVVRSVAKDSQGNIYAGAYNEIGVLKRNKYGEREYHSLVSKIPEKNRDFQEIWKIYTTNEGVIFQSFSTIFLYHQDTVHVLAEDRNFHFSFYTNNNLYITSWDKGLMKFTGQEFNQMPSGEFFSGERKIWSIMSMDSTRLLIGTQGDGMYIYEEGKVNPWKTNANDFLKKHQLFSAAKMPKGNFAFGSIQNGLIISDKQGNIIQHLNKKQGLENNTILSLDIDKWGNMWCGLDNGISYTENHSPVTYLNDALGIEGKGYASAYYKGRLFAGTNQGAFVTAGQPAEEGPLNNGNFEKIPGMKGQVWKMKVMDERLFCGHNRGAFIFKDDELRHVWKADGCWDYLEVPDRDSLIIAGTYNGLARLVKERDKWQFDGYIQGFSESSRDILFDDNNDLWMSHGYTGVYRLNLNQEMDSVLNVTHYGKEHGLHKNYRNYVFKYNNEVFVSRPDSVLKYNALTDRFEYSSEMTLMFGGTGISRTQYDQYDNLWYSLGQQNKIKVELSEQSPWKHSNMEILNKLNDHFVQAYEHINVINENNVIFGGEYGFAHFDPLLVNQLNTDFNTIITRVEALGKNDSLQSDLNISENAVDSIGMEFSPGINTVKIFYAAAFFEDPGKTRYSYKLNHFGKDKWSNWSSASVKEYTNIPSGDYVFSVKAKNVYGVESEPVDFHFVIPPPWYKTVWAYISYIFISGFAILFLLHYVEKYIQKERETVNQLREQELREKEKQHHRQSLEYENEIMQLKNAKLQSEIARKKSDAELKNKELASFAVQINYKNEILTKLRQELERVKARVDKDAQIQLNQIKRKIDEDVQLDEDWKNFKMHFDQVQGDFIHKMQEKYPNLTPKDLKLCAFLRMNLATKEIAPLMGISVRGVEIHRYRLRKKLEISRETNLVEFLMQQ